MTIVQRRAIISVLLIAIGLAAIGVLLFWWLWGVLAAYIQPETPTDKKDLVNIFVVIAAGVVGTLTAIAAVGNLIISRRNLQNAQANLQQQRDLDERRAQDEALQAYFERMGDLLTDHELMETTDVDDPKRLLARAQTLTLLERLNPLSNRARRRKKELVLFLYGAGLINKGSRIVRLSGADLRGVDLSGAELRGADLSEANLNAANFLGADLGEANLNRTDLTGANLSEATLSKVDLSSADLRGANLRGAKRY